MTFRACFLAVGLALAAFVASSFAAPGQALAHPGHHAEASEVHHPAPDSLDASASVSETADDGLADRRCLTVCCVGSSCCPSTVGAQDDDLHQFPSAARLSDLREPLKPETGVEPLAEPPRSFV